MAFQIDYTRIGGYPGPKHPGSNDDWGISDWKDELLAGSTRGQYAPGTPGTVTDRDRYTGQEFGRNDFVDAGGVPVISGSSEWWDWKNHGIVPGSQPAQAPSPKLKASPGGSLSEMALDTSPMGLTTPGEQGLLATPQFTLDDILAAEIFRRMAIANGPQLAL